MKTIKVVAAVIIQDELVLATQRSYGDYKGKWEFPGGKIENNETKEEALIREIKEELSVDIKVNKHYLTVEYQYPDFYLEMDCYLCDITRGSIKLTVHSNLAWTHIDDLEKLDWLEADKPIISLIKSQYY